MSGESLHWWADDDVRTLASWGNVMGDSSFPLWLVKVMAHESGCSPDPHHYGPARGLIQFEPATLRILGWKGTPDDFAAQGVGLQLPWVVKYYRSHCGKLHSLADVYVCNFFPADVGVDEDYHLCEKDGFRAWAYRANAGFDVQRKGYITPADCAAAAESAFGQSKVAQDLAARLAALSISTESGDDGDSS